MLKIFISSLLLLSGSTIAAEITVHQNNAIQHAMIADHARLIDAYQQIQFSNNINWSAASLTTPKLTTSAEKNKKEVINELKTLTKNNIEHKNDLISLVQYLEDLSVAGRINTKLDPDWVSLHAEFNRPIVGQYDLYTSEYPGKIHVIGLTQQIDVAVMELAKVHDYLQLVASSDLTDPDHAYLIEPDGLVYRVGIGVWNRKNEPVVSPGSTIFVGIDPSSLPTSHDAINEHITAVLANRIPE